MRKLKPCEQCSGIGLIYDMDGEEDVCKHCQGYGEVEQPTGNEKLTREELNYYDTNTNSIPLKETPNLN